MAGTGASPAVRRRAAGGAGRARGGGRPPGSAARRSARPEEAPTAAEEGRPVPEAEAGGGAAGAGEEGPAAREESEHWELVRLRVEASTLGAENESLKAQAKELQEQLLVQEAARRSETRDLAGSKRAVSEGAARRVAELEVLVERQRAALHDLVVASDSLASDNLLLSSEVVTLRGEKVRGPGGPSRPAAGPGGGPAGSPVPGPPPPAPADRLASSRRGTWPRRSRPWRAASGPCRSCT